MKKKKKTPKKRVAKKVFSIQCEADIYAHFEMAQAALDKHFAEKLFKDTGYTPAGKKFPKGSVFEARITTIKGKKLPK